jgi:peptide/nickel transport system permease protein
MKPNTELKFGAAIILFLTILSMLSFFWTPHDSLMMDDTQRFLHPSMSHLLGTDNFGRDVFSRIMSGAKNSIAIALCTVLCAAAVGSILGLASGYKGGLPDEIIVRLIDTLNSFPGIVLALLMAAVFDNRQFSLFLALFVLSVPSFTRVMRTGAMQFRNSAFVQAEKIIGAGFFRITFIHIFPNLAPSLASAVVIGLSNIILAESAMSYLGLGIQPPEPSWGRMLYESQNYFFNAPWASLAPGLFIMLAVIAFHALGSGIRRALGGKNV